MITKPILPKKTLSLLTIFILFVGYAYAQAKLTPQEKKLLKSSAYFYSTNHTLNKASEHLLDQLVAVLKAHPGLHLTIEGHTCNIGKAEAANKTIANKRANATKNYFIKKGIDSKRLKTIGYGSLRPAAKNDTEFGRIRNRRVTFSIK